MLSLIILHGAAEESESGILFHTLILIKRLRTNTNQLQKAWHNNMIRAGIIRLSYLMVMPLKVAQTFNNCLSYYYFIQISNNNILLSLRIKQ